MYTTLLAVDTGDSNDNCVGAIVGSKFGGVIGGVIGGIFIAFIIFIAVMICCFHFYKNKSIYLYKICM